MIDIQELEDFSEVVDLIEKSLGDTKYIVYEIERYISDKTSYRYNCILKGSLYEWLSDEINRHDCKNGCQWDEEKNEFIINGSFRDTVTLRFKKSDKFIDSYDYNLWGDFYSACKEKFLGL